MAAPATKTLRDLNGTWVMNKTLSDSPDPALALQGIGWLTRKGIGLATVTLHIKQYDEAGVTHIDIEQTATGGVKGTTENRSLDNEWREHGDWLFGKVKARSQWVSEPVADEPYLNTNWEEGTTEWVYNIAESLGNGWTAQQTWGFQVVKGERRYARNVVMKKGSKKEEFRMFYDFVPAQ